jgi:hypothetical protein
MPKLSDPEAQPPIRGLLVGDSGTGKTGALASLVRAGFNLYLADFDNGHEILRNVLIKHAAEDGKPKNFYLDKVDVEVCRDKYGFQGVSAVPKDARAWAKGIKYIETVLNKGTWNDILAIDSMSFAAKSAMIYTLKINNRLLVRPYESDWGDAQRLVESLAAMLDNDAIRCHIIATAHLAYSGGKERITTKGPDGKNVTELIDAGPERGLPSMIGKAINPVIPRYFNHTLLTRSVGSGNALKQTIHTRAFDTIELKNTNPGVIKPEYPLASGLADYFKDAGVTPQPQSQQKVA